MSKLANTSTHRTLVRVVAVDTVHVEFVLPGWKHDVIVTHSLNDVSPEVRSYLAPGARLYVRANLNAEGPEELHLHTWELPPSDFDLLKQWLEKRYHEEIEAGRRSLEMARTWLGSGQPGIVDRELAASRMAAARAAAYERAHARVLEIEQGKTE